MDTKEMTRERISAFADGECDDVYVDIVLAALQREKGKVDWEIYHQIGDVLRSDDMAMQMSPGFTARMAAKLDAEPLYLAPSVNAGTSVASQGAATARRWALPGLMAASVAAMVTFFVTPKLMVVMKGGQSVESVVRASAVPAAIIAVSVPQSAVLRDERIDDYLLAHQRFSPSVFSSTQYARSATFAVDSNK
jgi:sigma-E factor negative regulatory protein RseA